MREEEISVRPLSPRHEQAHVEVHVLVALDEIERVELEQREAKENAAQARNRYAMLGGAQSAKD
jgi:hypothetical protein